MEPTDDNRRYRDERTPLRQHVADQVAAHRQGTITMSQTELANGKDAQAKNLAADIVTLPSEARWRRCRQCSAEGEASRRAGALDRRDLT